MLLSFKSLSARLLLLTFVWVSFIVSSIGYTMLLNWELEATAAGKFVAAEIRYTIFRAALFTQPNYSDETFEAEAANISRHFHLLESGDQWLPLEIPATPDIDAHLKSLESRWHDDLYPMLERARESGVPVMLPSISQFAEEVSNFADEIEAYRADYLWQLRYLQILLIVLAIGSFFAIIALLLRWVIRPLDDLGEGIRHLSAGDLKARVTVREPNDEIGRITAGFNRMADRLDDFYSNLEQKVAEKTAVVEEKNRHLAQLYEISSFFSRQRSLDDMNAGFAERVMRYTEADACTIGIIDPRSGHTAVAHAENVPVELLQELAAQELEDVLCTRVFTKSYPICVHFDQETDDVAVLMHRYGFSTGYCFQVRSAAGRVGCFTLLFNEDPALSSQMVQLLESVSSHLGVAIDNTRLIERDRQFAVIQERQLLAQGLHDSIAQALSFLNLQVQLLDDGIKHKDDQLRDESLEAIKAGVQESYEDVRELLLNFRERLHKGGFVEGVKSVIDRFEGQAHVCARLTVRGAGPDLTERQQLQVIFIIQEALSNVRKHAEAANVDVEIDNEEDLVVSIEDDGIGIDERLVSARKGQHVGLSIMAERASRIGASVDVARVSPEGGTRVVLTLPAAARRPH